MALRLAGEEFSVVRGLDARGWPREIEANDADPGLKITQSGSGPGVKVVSGDIDLNSNLLKNAKLGTALNANGQDITAVNRLATANLSLKEVATDFLEIQDAAGSARQGLRVSKLYFYTEINAPTGDVPIMAWGTEVARVMNTAPGRLRLQPVELRPSAQPGTLVEGHFWYDSTAKKLKFYNGTAVETVTSS